MHMYQHLIAVVSCRVTDANMQWLANSLLITYRAYASAFNGSCELLMLLAEDYQLTNI